jgi:hypothetical protein
MVVYRSLIAPIALLAIGLSAGGALAAQREETTTEKTVAAQGVVRLKVRVEIGPVHLIADDGDAVQIKAVRVVEGGTATDRRRWLQEPKVTIESQGDTVEVRDVIPDSLKRRGSGRYNYDWPHARDFKMHLDVDIRLPRRLISDLSTGIGDLTVDGQAGAVTADAGVGAVKLTHLACGENPVSAHTGAGNVRVEGRMGGLSAAAGAGNITVEGEVRDLTIHDGAGKIDLNRLTGSGRQWKVDVGAGNVTMALRALPTESLSVHSGVGNLKVTLPARLGASVNLNTGMGHVTSALTLANSHRNGGEFGQTLSGRLNGGGPTLRLDVGMGDIQLASAQD